jgi:hypothetical protein
MAWGHANPYAVYTDWMQLTTDPRWLKRCLTPIGEGIRKATRELAGLTPDDDEATSNR